MWKLITNRIHPRKPAYGRIIIPGPVRIPVQPKIILQLLAIIPVRVLLYTAFTSKNLPLCIPILTLFQLIPLFSFKKAGSVKRKKSAKGCFPP